MPLTTVPNKDRVIEISDGLLISHGRKKPYKLTLPENLKEHILVKAIKLFLLSKTSSYSTKTLQAYAHWSNTFFKFLIECEKTGHLDSINILKRFKQYLIKKGTITTSAGISAPIVHVKFIINTVCNQFEGVEERHLFKVLANAPANKNTRNDTKPKKSLYNLFPDCTYSDSDFIKSLRMVCAYILFEFQRQRDVLRSYMDSNKLINDTGFIESKCFRSGYISDYCIRDDAAAELYGKIIQSVLDSGDSLIIERLALSYSPLNAQNICDKTWLVPFLMKSVSKKNKGMNVSWEYKNKSYSLRIIQSMALIYNFCPTEVEVMCIQMLLASERVQASNQQRLRISDFISNVRGIQVYHKKSRRGKGKKQNATATQKSDTLIHDAYQGYLDLLNDAQIYLPEELKDIALPYLVCDYSKDSFIGLNNNWRQSFFKLIVNPDSAFYKNIYELIGSDALPFLWLINSIINHNEKVVEQEIIYRKMLYKARKENIPQPSRAEFVTLSSISIAVDFISKSRTNMNAGFSITPKTQDSSFDASQNTLTVHLDAQANAHSLSTARNTYQTGNNSKESMISHYLFSKQVGEEMEKDARKIIAASKLEIGRVVSLEEAKKLLCVNECNDFLSLISAAEGIDVSPELGISSEEQILFVKDKIVAAQILLKIEHINREMPALINDTLEKAARALEEKAFLLEVLNQFPSSTLNEGRALSLEIDMPFASMV